MHVAHGCRDEVSHLPKLGSLLSIQPGISVVVLCRRITSHHALWSNFAVACLCSRFPCGYYSKEQYEQV